jgi:hypothetical protein
MVETARDARAVFLRTIEVGPEKSREYRTEPGTASRTAETKGPKPPHPALPIARDRTSPLSTPQKPAGSRPLHLGQRLWGPSGLHGGDERTQTTCHARSPIEPVSVRPPRPDYPPKQTSHGLVWTSDKPIADIRLNGRRCLESVSKVMRRERCGGRGA